jgi:hypothetical protein
MSVDKTRILLIILTFPSHILLISEWSKIVPTVLSSKSPRVDTIVGWKFDREWSRRQPTKMVKDFSKRQIKYDWYDDMKLDDEFIYLAHTSNLGQIFVFDCETLEVVHVLELKTRPGEKYVPTTNYIIRTATNEDFLVANVQSAW